MPKTVFITGGARGIGKSCAELFYKNGYNVALCYSKSEKEALLLKKSLPGSLILKGDVSIEQDVKEMIENTVSHFGRIDVLINNAGISQTALVTDIELPQWEEVFAVNVRGTFLCAKYAAHNMIKNHSGKIINVSSIWGVCGSAMESCYSASKGAVISFTKALAKELGPSNITVNCIAPGFIDTDMNKNISQEDKKAFMDETPLGKIGTPEDVTKTMLFLASDGADFITGQVIGVDGGVIL